MATAETSQFPDHQIGDTWGYSFDFSEFPESYLDGAEAYFEVRSVDNIDADPILVLDSVSSALTVDSASKFVLINEIAPDLESAQYYCRLRLEWPDHLPIPRKRTVVKGTWRLVK